jgi:hypothetical protein
MAYLILKNNIMTQVNRNVIIIYLSHYDDVPIYLSHYDDVPVYLSHYDDVPVYLSHYVILK